MASIKTRTDGTGDVYTVKRFRFDFSGPRIIIENFRLRDLIVYAYDIKDYPLFGEPRWAIRSMPDRTAIFGRSERAFGVPVRRFDRDRPRSPPAFCQ